MAPASTETGIDYLTGALTPDTYTLQLNTNVMSGSPACAGAQNPTSCLAWEQFVYSATYNGVFISYWLINYSNTCPGGWIAYGPDCYQNSAGAFLTTERPTIASLTSVSLTGTATEGGSDTVVMTYGAGNMTALQEPDSVLDLADGGWTAAEFGVVGDGNGTEATFSSGSTINVETAVNNGAPTAPTCAFEGFTAETNNLSFGTSPNLIPGSEPSIETQQTTSDGPEGCTAAAKSPVSLTNPGAQTSSVGNPVSLQMQGSDTTAPQNLTWSATGLPAGLSINPSSGLISGTPSAPGTTPVIVTATDNTGATDSITFPWTTADVVAVNNPGSQTNTVGDLVSLQLQGTDSGKESLTFTGSRLPQGLTMSRTGLITGTATTSGTEQTTITATDPTGASATITFSWQINAKAAGGSSGGGTTGSGGGGTTGSGGGGTTGSGGGGTAVSGGGGTAVSGGGGTAVSGGTATTGSSTGGGITGGAGSDGSSARGSLEGSTASTSVATSTSSTTTVSCTVTDDNGRISKIGDCAQPSKQTHRHLRAHVAVHDNSLRVTAVPGTGTRRPLQCSLVLLHPGRRSAQDTWSNCWTSTEYAGLSAGRYRLRIRGTGGEITLHVTIR